jgi:hypothetical protein
MRHAREVTGDTGTPRRLVVIAAAVVFVIGARFRATAANSELCRQFDRECTEARAAGYRDVGICHVERLECLTDDDAPRSHRTRRATGTGATPNLPSENGRSAHDMDGLATWD